MSLHTKKYCKFPKDKKAARVAVAKDVIEQILSEKLQARSGWGYVSPKDFNYRMKPSDNDFDSIAECCNVCAMGAAMLSAFRLYDGEGFREIWLTGVDRHAAVVQLDGVFGRQMLFDIELAFEADCGCRDIHEPGSPRYFGGAFKNDDDRLIAIMQNIVDHDGEFRPEVEYEIVTT